MKGTAYFACNWLAELGWECEDLGGTALHNLLIFRRLGLRLKILKASVSARRLSEGWGNFLPITSKTLQEKWNNIKVYPGLHQRVNLKED